MTITKNARIAVLVSSLFYLCMPGISHANSLNLEHPVYSLAQGCYAIKGQASGKFMQIYADGAYYHFDQIDASNAAHFYFKPTSLGKFMLYDRSSGYLAARLPRDPTRGTYAGDFAEYQIEHNGGNSYKLRNTKFGDTLKYLTDNGNTYFIDLLNPGNNGADENYELVPQSDCQNYPEAELNLTQHQAVTTPAVGEPIVGFVDDHTHLTSYMFMGGKFLHGKSHHRFGITKALDDGSGYHGPWGALDLIGNLQAHNDVNARHDTRGWPEFPSWPNATTQSHQQAYYRWIERAYHSGLRVMVAHLVENNVLCSLQTALLPPNWLGHNTCDEMQSISDQNQALHDMVNYIDAQAGGPGKGFVRIVTSATESRQAIADGKLAMIKGVEISRLFGCNISGCSNAHVETQVQALYDMGIRSFFPVHKFDNAFGGAWLKGASDLINMGNYLQNGQLFDAVACEGENQTWGKLPDGFPLIGSIPALEGAINGLLNGLGLGNLSKNYDQTAQTHCNPKGLTDTGRYLINAMIDREMIIEIDHMSYPMQQTVLDIAEKRGYSGIISGHDTFSGKAIDHRILNLGGIYGFYFGDAARANSQIAQISDAQKQYPYAVGVPIGTDVNGLAPQAQPSAGNNVSYPFTSYDGRVTFAQQKTGNRTFEVNNEGLAHYGLLPDMIERMRLNLPNKTDGTPNTELLKALFNSAEAYLQMWERAETQNHIVNTPEAFSQLYLPYLGKCLEAEGDWDGAKIRPRECNMSLNQSWKQLDNGSIVLGLDSSKCIDLAGAHFVAGRDFQIYSCNGTSAQLFSEPRSHDAGRLRMQHAIQHCIDVKDWGLGDKIEYQPCRDYSPGQTFAWRKKQLNNYSYIVNNGTQACLDVPGVEPHDGLQIRTHECVANLWHLQWRHEPLTGLIHNRHRPYYCLDHGSQDELYNVIAYRCTPSDNQRWQAKQDAGKTSFHPVNKPHLIMRPGDGTVNSPLLLMARAPDAESYNNWHIRPASYRHLVFARSGLCMQATNMQFGEPVTFAQCRNYYSGDLYSQYFQLTADNKLQSLKDNNFCVEYAGLTPESGLQLGSCAANSDNQWNYQGGLLRPAAQTNLVVGSNQAHVAGAQLKLVEKVTNKEQGWQWGNGRTQDGSGSL